MKISIKTSKFILSVFITITIVINGFTCFASSPPLIGDADTDGKVNIKDATLIQKHIAGIVTLSDEGYKSADTNNDGKVNVKDATLIQKFIAGIVTEFPTTTTTTIISLSEIPLYDTSPYYIVNNNLPFFTDTEKSITYSFEAYSPLDILGRCQAAYANIGIDLMPTEDREDISSVYPSGWKHNEISNNNKYDIITASGGYIYNRCHLIGFQLTGENANEKNLITGTSYFNVTGMLPFENLIDDYVEETKNHVLYRVTPMYYENDLVAQGVLMEAWSVEDNGDGVCFNVYSNFAKTTGFQYEVL